MNPQVKAIPLIVVGVLLNAFAQICLKKGLVHGMSFELGPSSASSSRRGSWRASAATP